MSSLVERRKKRDPESEALIRDLVGLAGPDGSDQSDREIEAEMVALDVKISHERIRQYRNDQWDTLNRATRRKIRIYVKWKTANLSNEAGLVLRDEAAREEAERKELARKEAERARRTRKG